jgi:hypothetical protein
MNKKRKIELEPASYRTPLSLRNRQIPRLVHETKKTKRSFSEEELQEVCDVELEILCASVRKDRTTFDDDQFDSKGLIEFESYCLEHGNEEKESEEERSDEDEEASAAEKRCNEDEESHEESLEESDEESLEAEAEKILELL